MAEPLFTVLRAPRELVSGAGQRAALPAHASRLGKRAFVVTDERLAGDPQFLALVAGLRDAGLAVEVFAGTIPELPAASIEAGLAVGRAFDADLVIGIGGGSCMDAAKVIGLLLCHGGRPADYYGEFKVPGPVLPLIAVPTTAGTGSEVTPVAVVSDPDRPVKVGISSPHLIPTVAICDPELTWTCPRGLTATSGADALTHAIEAFTTRRRDWTGTMVHEHVFVGKNALSDHNALQAIRLIAGSLRTACDHGGDHDARGRMMLGASLAGMAFGTAGCAAAHAVQYPVGALTHTAHGTGVAVMMPYVMAFNLSHATEAMAEVAEAMGVDVAGMATGARAEAAVRTVADLFAAIGIPATLRDLGLAEDKLAWTAEQALGATRLVKNNPRPLDPDAMAQLVTAAYHGDLDALRAPLAETETL